MAMKKVTLKDIASETGVSIVTVSKVLKQKYEKVASPETTDRIQRIADELGYKRPKDQLRINVIIAPSDVDVYNPYYTDILSGIKETALSLKAELPLIVTLDELLRSPEQRSKALESGVQNAIIVGESFQENLGNVKKCFKNVVSLLNHNPEKWENDVLITDLYAAGRDVMNQLIAFGRTRILFMGPRIDRTKTDRRLFEGRALAYLDVLTEKGLPIRDELIHDCAFDPDTAYRILSEILDAGAPHFDALVMGDDMMAMAAIKALNEHRVSIPEEVAVVGFNNQDFCNYSFPPLSTVDLHNRELGRLAVQVAHMKANGGVSLPLKFFLPCTFVRRGSCGTYADDIE